MGAVDDDDDDNEGDDVVVDGVVAKYVAKKVAKATAIGNSLCRYTWCLDAEHAVWLFWRMM